ncbi:MAG: FKBP-type peptidyl-prolyl cis-trans isomerase [Sphingobacteriales bacterium]|nr:MAG: FKBP-type peptidyl-prolyl cis-trans isomerase [Sphingobacteriales bacterium]
MYFKTLLSVATVGLLLAGCKEQGFKKTKGGMPYKLITKSGAQKVKPNEWVKIHYVVSINTGGKDSILNSTYVQGAPYYMPIGGPAQPYDVSEVFSQLHKGDSLIAMQAMDTFLRKSPDMVPPFFKKGGTITTRLKVVDIFPTQDAARADEMKSREDAFKNNTALQGSIKQDQKTIRDFLGASAAQAKETPGGAYLLITTPGNGTQATKGMFVDVFYTGRTIGGVVFDSNTDTSFHHTQALSFQTGQGQMLRGFDEAVQMMKQGDKGRVLIPGALAYGQNPPPGSKINPNDILIFDLDLRNVSNQDPRGAVPPPPPGPSH